MVEKGNIKPGGRPTKYKPAFNKQAYKLCLLGATDKELADFFETDERTINRWKKENKGFCQSLKEGKMQADSLVAEKLFKRATGYSHPDEQVFLYYGKPVVVKTVKHYPPDTTAAIFWLKNRSKDKWRDNQSFEHRISRLPDDQLDQLINEIINPINETAEQARKN